MKTIYFLLSCLISIQVSAQNCNDFYSFKTGTSIEYIHNNAKGKMESISKMTVSDVSTTDGIVTLKTDNVFYDDKEKETYKFQQTYYCQDGNITFDMSNMFDPKTMEGYKDMQVSMTSDKLDLPNSLSVGQTLKEGNATMVISNQGMKLMTMSAHVFNRKVDSQETITVPAGTYNCYKITYDVESKVMFKIQGKAAEWYAKGVGMVKQETYDSKGKITGSTLLKSIK
ncbi:MAG: DUF3108 domain-containing protein [Bacteroidales bacterium]|nr:DUF3108 domain-containing protein [Bacteroidales bacterium]